jgi:hypothetical protein
MLALALRLALHSPPELSDGLPGLDRLQALQALSVLVGSPLHQRH